MKRNLITRVLSLLTASAAILCVSASVQAADKKPNIVMLMCDDAGVDRLGLLLGGGKAMGHPTPNIDKMAKEGATFTSWYGQSSCTAGRSSFITGRIPIRTALSIVVAPGDENYLLPESHRQSPNSSRRMAMDLLLGQMASRRQTGVYPIEHGFDEMKEFAALLSRRLYLLTTPHGSLIRGFRKYNKQFWDMYQKVVNLYEWEGVAGQPAKKVARIDYDDLREFDSAAGRFGGRIHQAHAKGRSHSSWM